VPKNVTNAGCRDQRCNLGGGGGGVTPPKIFRKKELFFFGPGVMGPKNLTPPGLVPTQGIWGGGEREDPPLIYFLSKTCFILATDLNESNKKA
jgi:hypothetical protein